MQRSSSFASEHVEPTCLSDFQLEASACASTYVKVSERGMKGQRLAKRPETTEGTRGGTGSLHRKYRIVKDL